MPGGPPSGAPPGARLLVGAALGAAAGAIVGAAELALLFRSAWGYFDGLREVVPFAAAVLGILALAGAPLGAALALGWTALARIAGAAPRRQAVAVAGVAVAPSVAVALLAFSGPTARTLPARPLLLAATALAGVAAAFIAARLTLRELAASDGRSRAARVGRSLGLVALLLGLVAADAYVLPRLYPFFHVGLELVAFATALALAGAAGAARSRRRGPILAVAVLAGVAGWWGLDGARGLRTLALERLALTGRLLTAGARLGLHRASPARPVAAAPVVEPPRPRRTGPRLGDSDVIIITVDAWRADRAVPRVAPHLAALAASGVRFTRAYAQVPHTSFSVATLLTGKDVHALTTAGLAGGDADETLPRILRRERYKTAGFFPPAVFYVDKERLGAFEKSLYDFEYVKYEFLPAARRTDQVIRFFEDEHPKRAFVWVHYFEPHEPYDPHPPATTAASPTLERYEGEVRLVDAEVERLVGWLRAHRPESLIVLAADHGEEFGEHGANYHGTTLFEEQVRVPLSFTTLGGATLLSPHEVAAPVGLVDVAPTLLALLGVPTPARMRGQDLSPWLDETPPAEAPGPVFLALGQKEGVVDGTLKLVCDREADACRLYDLAADPAERTALEGAAWEAPRARLGALLDERRARGADLERAARKRAVRPPQIEKLLDAARRGDRSQAPALARLVTDAAGDLELRTEAATLLTGLPPDPATRPLLDGVTAPPPALAPWLTIARARLGAADARATLPAIVEAACGPETGPDDAERCTRAALAAGDAPTLARALERPAVAEQFDLALQLVRALGASDDDRAVDPLIIQLAGVRTRLEVVRALRALGRPAALPTFARWVPHEPYIPVRVEMAAATAALAAPLAADDPRRLAARAGLEELAGAEQESRVLAEALPALAALGSPQVRPATQPLAVVAPSEVCVMAPGLGSVNATSTDPQGHWVSSPVRGGVACLSLPPGEYRLAAKRPDQITRAAVTGPALIRARPVSAPSP